VSDTALASTTTPPYAPPLSLVEQVERLTSVELFAGAGGLALGCQQAGFDSIATLERDRWACDTMRENKARGHELVANWKILEGDVREFDWSNFTDEVTLVAGGPPCQPFSSGGRGLAAADPRDMFPTTAEIIARLRPKAFIIENVRGLTRSTFADYYDYIQLRLALPAIGAKQGETWLEHRSRLRKLIDNPSSYDLCYHVVPSLVNAADYGVPQQRHRVFLVGFRNDLSVQWTFPKASHSRSALLYSQWVNEDYWDEHEIPRSKRPSQPKKSIPMSLFESEVTDRWRTVRDALVGLPAPTVKPSRTILNHVLQPGARSYPGHTGSLLDWPAKALKAGGHGVPGGENMLRQIDGRIRYFTVRESARLQTFPDDYELHGSWGEAMRQLGNAVPVQLAEIVAVSVYNALVGKGGSK
jgi:DNA (cytosine-5)-methyltransferase 1